MKGRVSGAAVLVGDDPNENGMVIAGGSTFVGENGFNSAAVLATSVVGKTMSLAELLTGLKSWVEGFGAASAKDVSSTDIRSLACRESEPPNSGEVVGFGNAIENAGELAKKLGNAVGEDFFGASSSLGALEMAVIVTGDDSAADSVNIFGTDTSGPGGIGTEVGLTIGSKVVAFALEYGSEEAAGLN